MRKATAKPDEISRVYDWNKDYIPPCTMWDANGEQINVPVTWCDVVTGEVEFLEEFPECARVRRMFPAPLTIVFHHDGQLPDPPA